MCPGQISIFLPSTTYPGLRNPCLAIENSAFFLVP
jgi:hypothetical protein